MIQPDDIVDFVSTERLRIGDCFSLMNAVDALERVYESRYPVDDDLEPGTVFIAGKFDSDNHRRFDIGIYPSYSIYQPIEILLTYPTGIRNWMLPPRNIETLEFSPENGIDFSSIRKTKWFRRYKTTKPKRFICRMKTPHELERSAIAMSNAFDSGL